MDYYYSLLPWMNLIYFNLKINFQISFQNKCYIVIRWFMQKYTYIYWIRTDAMNNRRRKTSLQKYIPLTLLQGFERVIQGLRVRGSWRSNINCNILTPKLWPSALCLSCSSDAQPEPWGPLCWVLAFFIASYQHLLWTPTPQGPNGPFGLMSLSLPHFVSNSVRSSTQWLVELNWVI